MAEQSKMVSVRLPVALVTRTDYIVRNPPNGVNGPKNRSSAFRAALEAWLPGQEDRLEKLGVLQKKAR